MSEFHLIQVQQLRKCCLYQLFIFHQIQIIRLNHLASYCCQIITSTHTHTLFITILLPLRISCTFASLSPDPALPDSVVHVTAICSHPSQASMPFLIPLMCLSCLSLCQSFFHFFISCRVLLLISKSIYFRYHSQCYFFFVLNDTL